MVAEVLNIDQITLAQVLLQVKVVEVGRVPSKKRAVRLKNGSKTDDEMYEEDQSRIEGL